MRSVLAFCKRAGAGFWVSRFSKKNANPFAVLSSAYFAPTLFSSAVLAFCKCAGGGFWVPRFSKKNANPFSVLDFSKKPLNPLNLGHPLPWGSAAARR